MSGILRVERWSGAAIKAVLPKLAKLRIAVFREFPYLYEGDTAYEEQYLKTYMNIADSVMALVKDGERVVGASSGLPLMAPALHGQRLGRSWCLQKRGRTFKQPS